MAQLNLNKERLDASIGVIQASANEGILEVFQELAHVLNEEHDNNEVAAQAYEACRTFQELYNPYVPGVRAVMESFRSVKEIADYLDTKIDLGSVAKRDTSFSTETIDADAAKL